MMLDSRDMQGMPAVAAAALRQHGGRQPGNNQDSYPSGAEALTTAHKTGCWETQGAGQHQD